jgi:hypothetical protein
MLKNFIMTGIHVVPRFEKQNNGEDLKPVEPVIHEVTLQKANPNLIQESGNVTSA